MIHSNEHESKHLFNIFINDLDEWTESTLSRCANDTKLGGASERSKDCTALQKDLNRLEKWAKRNLRKFNITNEVLPLKNNKSMH